MAGAIIAPSDSDGMVQPSGVFDAAGNYVHQAVLWRVRPLMIAPPLPDVHDHLSGRWIWGGVLFNHFGHFLIESSGRLWALDALAGADGIVFLAKHGTTDEIDLQPYHKAFFDLLGVNLPIRVITRPTRVDLLEVPGQGFGIGRLASGTGAFRAFMQGRFGQGVVADGADSLYISRSGLGALRGGILHETRLDGYLAACGYEIFHPQQHPLQVQVARYKAARRIIALDGSALHLVAMVAGPDQQVAIIKRRESGATDSIVAHLHSFAGRAPLVLDAIRADWIRSDRKRADRLSFGELDFQALGRALSATGMVPAETDWPSLTVEESSAAVRQIERQLKRRKLTFHPIMRGDAPVALLPEKRNLRREARMAQRQTKAGG